MARTRSTTAAEDNDQRNEVSIDDTPSTSLGPPPSFPTPDKPVQRPDEPPSVELEGERKSVASCDAGPTAGETHVLGASRREKDARKRPKKPRNALEHVRGHLERKGPEDSPRRAPDEPEGPGGETAVPGGVQRVQEDPRSVRNERADETDSPRRDWPPLAGGHLGDREKSEVDEGDPDCAKVVEGAGHNGKRLESIRNQRDVETNALHRVRGPVGHLGEEVGLGDVEGDWKRLSDDEGIYMDGRRFWIDGATSGARHDSKQVETRPLAGVKTGQHQQCNRTTAHVPRTSTPPPRYARSLSDYVNPPRRRGRIKTRSRQISQTRARKLTHHIERSRRSHIGGPRSNGYTP